MKDFSKTISRLQRLLRCWERTEKVGPDGEMADTGWGTANDLALLKPHVEALLAQVGAPQLHRARKAARGLGWLIFPGNKEQG